MGAQSEGYREAMRGGPETPRAGLGARLKSYMPRPMVFFPKSVIINNPWLSFVYWSLLASFILLAGFMFFGMKKHDQLKAVTGEVSVLPWRLERRLADVQASVAQDTSKSFCSDPDHYTYESSAIAYQNITCAKLCSKANRGVECMHPREASMLEGPAAVFVPTFYTNEILSPATGSTTTEHFFVPGAEDSQIAFRHRLSVPEKKYNVVGIIMWLLSPFTSDKHSAMSTEDTGDSSTRMKTIFLDKDGTVKQTFEPGEVVSLTVGGILQSAIVDEFVDTVSKLSLDDHYMRVEENILADRGPTALDRGPTARLTGTRITVNLEYTDTGRCSLDPASPQVHSVENFDGYVACMSIKAARSWTTLDRTSVVGEDGTQTNRRYHGLRVAFHTHGRFAFTDLISIWEWITIFMIWSQIPTAIVYMFVITLLGNLSDVYRHVIHQGMKLEDMVTGLGARLISHSSSFLDMKEGAVLNKKKLLDRFMGIFRHSEDLDDEEVKKFVDFVYTGMMKESSKSGVSLQAYCDACTTNEPLSLNQLVDIFDADRKLNPLEWFFNDPTIDKLRRDAKNAKSISEESVVLTRPNGQSIAIRNAAGDGSSQFEKIFFKTADTSGRVNFAIGNVTKSLDKWLAESNALDKEALFARKRAELAQTGKPERRGFTVTGFGSCYEGEWVGNYRHGQGTETDKNGHRYEGQWAANVKHGKGVLTMPNGSKYDGEWFNGKRHGRGFETAPDGTKYEGEHDRGNKSGQGSFAFADGDTYRGQVFDNKMHGQGEYRWINGHVYQGQLVNDEMHGEGTSISPNGMKYTGQYAHGMKDGRGVISWPDGRRYEGQFEKHERHGEGIFRSPDGTVVEGKWERGKQHGRGTITLSNGKLQVARWDNGRRIHLNPRLTSGSVMQHMDSSAANRYLSNTSGSPRGRRSMQSMKSARSVKSTQSTAAKESKPMPSTEAHN